MRNAADRVLVVCLAVLFAAPACADEARGRTLYENHCQACHSKKVHQRERSVVLRHVTKNAFIPVVTFVGLQVGVAVSGSIIIESIFNMPGMGKYIDNAERALHSHKMLA